MTGQWIDWWVDGGYRREPARPGCKRPGFCSVRIECTCATWQPLPPLDRGAVEARHARRMGQL